MYPEVKDRNASKALRDVLSSISPENNNGRVIFDGSFLQVSVFYQNGKGTNTPARAKPFKVVVTGELNGQRKKIGVVDLDLAQHVGKTDADLELPF